MDLWMNDELSTSVTAKFKYTDKHIKHNISKKVACGGKYLNEKQ